MTTDPIAQHRRQALRRLIDASGESLNAWTKAAGVAESTVRSFLDGTSESMSDRTYRKLSDRYGISIARLKGEEPGNADPIVLAADRKRGRLVPVRGYVGAGAEVHPVGDDDTPLDPVEVLGAGDDVEAVIVRGDSMAPVFRDRDIILFRRRTLPARDLLGEECVVQLADGRAFIKILMQGSEPTLFTLLSHNQAVPPIVDVAIAWAVPVVQRISGRWQLY